MMSNEPTYIEDELNELEQSVQNSNTSKRNKTAEKKLRKHLEKNGFSYNVDIRTIPYECFNELLRHLWFEARQANGQKYRASSLENLYHSINRVLKTYDFEDLNKSTKWQCSNEAYKNAMRQLKQEGLGYV